MASIPFNPAEIAIAIENTIEEEAIDAYGTFIKLVVPATPKDTGLAQGNWRTSISAPAIGVIARKSGAQAVAAGLKSVKSAKKKISKGKQGSIYIVNNLPYIGRLNNGYSQQAPAYFIEIAFGEATRPRTRRRKNI